MTRWEQFFREDERVLSVGPTECAELAVEEFKVRGVSTVLDLGCGTGRDSILFAEHGFSVTAVDAARSALEIARRIGGQKAAGIDFIEADARQLPFACRMFDAVHCFGLLHEFTDDSREHDVKRVMTEIHRVLRPAGLLVLGVLAGQPSQGLPHVCLFSEAMFDRAGAALELISKSRVADLGCTGHRDYVIWRGLFER
jgi:ubiquinone/menaquinone biosynthesis C-methylase UbiE